MNTIIDVPPATTAVGEVRERPTPPAVMLPLAPVRAAKECNFPKSCTYPLCEC